MHPSEPRFSCSRLFSKEMQPQFISHHGNTFGQEWFTKAGKSRRRILRRSILAFLRRFPVPIPPAAEQEQIIDEVAERLSMIEAGEVAIDDGLRRTTHLRQQILERAFEGKLVPQDAADEPAHVLLDRIRQQRTHAN